MKVTKSIYFIVKFDDKNRTFSTKKYAKLYLILISK